MGSNVKEDNMENPEEEEEEEEEEEKQNDVIVFFGEMGVHKSVI